MNISSGRAVLFIISIALAVASFVACDNRAHRNQTKQVTADWERVIGFIPQDIVDVHGITSRSPLILPDTIRKGVPFEATVLTYGSSSCLRADGAEIKIVGLSADVTPYDLSAKRNGACTEDMSPNPRTVTLSFDSAGQALIRVHGQSLPPVRPTVYHRRVIVYP